MQMINQTNQNFLELCSLEVLPNLPKQTFLGKSKMRAQNGTINFKIDTGADVTDVPQEELTKLNIHLNELKQTPKKLTGPGNNKLKCIGYTYTSFQWGDKHSTELIYICQNLTKALLVKPAINRLQITKLDKPSTYSCNEISTIQLPHGHTSNHKQPVENKFIQDYPEFFNGLGDIESPPINIKLKPETHHTVLPHHVTFQYSYLRQWKRR